MTINGKAIGKDKLASLMAISRAADNRAAEERGAAAAKLKAASESDGLDLWAFRVAKQLAKQDAGVQTLRLGNLQYYCELLEIGTQMSFDQALRESDKRTEIEKVMDGEGARADAEPGEDRQAVMDGVLNRPKEKNLELSRFEGAMREAVDVDAVNRGLDRFSADHPDLADDALELAQKRLQEIAAEQGGGEDLRPRHLQEANQTRAPRARPHSPAAEAAQANGIGQ